jgi:Skp family chaperone for outer membrane proteins
MKLTYIICLTSIIGLMGLAYIAAQDQPAAPAPETKPAAPAPVAPPPVASASLALKIGVVNLQSVIDGYKKTKDVEKEIQRQKQQEEESIAKIDEELSKLRDQLEALTPGSELYRQTSEKIAMATAARKYKTDNLYQSIREHLNKQFAGLYNEIRSAIDRYAKENGYSFIFKAESLPNASSEAGDISSQITFRTVLYSPKEADITNDIISLLNK